MIKALPATAELTQIPDDPNHATDRAHRERYDSQHYPGHAK